MFDEVGRASETSSLSTVPDSESEALGVGRLTLKTPSNKSDASSSGGDAPSVAAEAKRHFWIEVPIISAEAKKAYTVITPPEDDARPVKIVWETKVDGTRYYYVLLRSQLYKKLPEQFFVTHAQKYGRLVDEYEEARDSGDLSDFDPSSTKILRADRMQPTKRSKVAELASRRRSAQSTRTRSSASEVEDPSSDDNADDDNDEDFEEEYGIVSRRSTRSKPTKFGPFSPTKQPRVPTRSSGRTNRRNYVEDLDYEIVEDSDDDFGELGPSKPAQKPKPRRKRATRPAYGSVRSVQDLDDSDSGSNPLRAHRETCEKCSKPPTHLMMVKVLKRGKAAFRRKKAKGPDADLVGSSDDEYTKTKRHGGWVRCLSCCVATHWDCLSKAQRDEILAAIVQKEGAAVGEDEIYEKRKTLDFEETTEFICGFCLRGGICMQCNQPVKTEDPPPPPKTPPNDFTGDNAAMNIDCEPVSAQDEVAPPKPAPDPAPHTVPKPLLFRCFTCKRPSHYEHLPPLEGASGATEEVAGHYQEGWLCQDCQRWEYPLDRILAWRPSPPDATEPPRGQGIIPYKTPLPREYLVKWDKKSFQYLEWVPHQWLLSTNMQKLRHFLTKGTRVRLLPRNHEQVTKLIAESKDPNNIPSDRKDLPTASDDVPAMKRARDAILNADDANTSDEGEGAEHDVSEGEPDANPLAELCVPRSWFVVDRVLDVFYWKRPRPLKKAAKTKLAKGKVSRARVQTSDEEVDELMDDSEPEFQPPVLQPGEQPDEKLVETIEEREAWDTTALSDRIDDVAWGFFKWRDLTHEDATWDSPPKKDTPEWEAFVQAYQAYLLGREVEVLPPTDRTVKERDKRTPKNIDIIKAIPFEQGGTLMPFQLEGLTWLYDHWYNKKACILADEMGLGKTVQATTFMGMLVQEQVFPLLVVVPNSTITNWMREFTKWAPHVRAVQFNGDLHSKQVILKYEMYHKDTTAPKFHVLVTTYETVTHPKEFPVFSRVKRWEMVLIDEGQRLKSDSSLIFKRLSELNTRHRVIMTGTPLNNNIRELFNLMNFLDPENWYDLKKLEKEFEELDEEKVKTLHQRLKPYFLRRLKTEVMTDLPPKNEVIVPVSMAPLQREVYKSVLESNLSMLATFASTGTAAKVKKTNLKNILMQLRKCMQHPYLTSPHLEVANLGSEEAHRQLVEASGKLKLLALLLPKLRERGHRVLIFSQFKIALDIIEDFVKGEGFRFLRLDGDTASDQRQRDMDAFNKPGSDIPLYLLSTRAGGVGINLWSADTVIIFDPDFNPHQDLQAIARAHRMGQKRKVLVFKLMTKGAAEEHIMQTGKKKLVLDHLIVQKMDADDGKEDVQSILSFGARAIFENNVADEIRPQDTPQDVDNLIEKLENQEPEPAMEAGQQGGMKFDFAKVYEADKNAMGEMVDAVDDTTSTDRFWAERLERARKLQKDLAAQEKTGRGVRRKATQRPMIMNDGAEFDSPEKSKPTADHKGKKRKGSDEDDDYVARKTPSVHSSEHGSDAEMAFEPTEGGPAGADIDLDINKPVTKKARRSYQLTETARELSDKYNALINDAASQSAFPVPSLPTATPAVPTMNKGRLIPPPIRTPKTTSPPAPSSSATRVTVHVADDDDMVCGICEGNHSVVTCPWKKSEAKLRERLEYVRKSEPFPGKGDIVAHIEDMIEDLRADRKATQAKALREAAARDSTKKRDKLSRSNPGWIARLNKPAKSSGPASSAAEPHMASTPGASGSKALVAPAAQRTEPGLSETGKRKPAPFPMDIN